jgi:hypothetical protein
MIVAVALMAALMPAPVGACSEVGPQPLDNLLTTGHLDTRPILGIHEQQHIAWTPAFGFLRSRRSASVVTRYWGSPPDLSVASHGEGNWFGDDDCSDKSGNLGMTSVHATFGSDDYPRTGSLSVELATGGRGARLSAAEEAALVERYGPAVAVSLGPDDFVVGYALILWRPLLWLTALGGAGFVARSRFRRRSFTPRGGELPRDGTADPD